MKLTTKQLKQMIKEELGLIMESKYADRFAARKAAGFDDEIMRQLDAIESSGDYENYVSSYELAASLGSEEEMLEELVFKMINAAEERIPRFVAETIKGIFSLPTRHRIRYWQNNGIDLDQYSKNPASDRGYWEPMHLTKEQLAMYEVRFLAEELRAALWDEMNEKSQELTNGDGADIFNARWMKVAPRFYKKIQMEIDKHLQNGNIKQIDGILYNPAPRI